jgi:hypothetical protein
MSEAVQGESLNLSRTIRMKPKPQSRVQVTGDTIMIIYMLAAAMTIAMLIATVFGLHQEAERNRSQRRSAGFPLRPRNPYQM